MNVSAKTVPSRRTHVAFSGSLALGYVLLALFIASVASGSIAARIPLLGLPTVVVLVSQLISRGARPRLDHLLCPRNFLLFLFYIQLILVPALIIGLGMAPGVLFHLPSDRSVSAALLLQTLAYVSCMIGLVIADHRSGAPAVSSTARHLNSTVAPHRPPFLALAMVALGLGIVGLMLRFGTIANVIGYFSGSSSVAYDLTNPNAGQASATQSISGALLPFLGIAFVLLGCRAIDRSRTSLGSAAGRLAVWGIVLIGIAASYSLYNYNRGAFVMPLLAMAATYSVRRRRLSLATAVVAAAVLLVPALVVGAFRTTYFSQQAQTGVAAAGGQDIIQSVQVYGQGPQFLALLLESTPPDVVPMGPGPIVASVLSPVPVLGRESRLKSSTTRFNNLEGGVGGVRGDQIVPLAGELFWSFHVYGVVGGYILLGLAVAWIDRKARRSSHALAAYAANYTGFWVAFLVIGSISILSQVAIYFLLPVALAMGANRTFRGAPRPGPRG